MFSKIAGFLGKSFLWFFTISILWVIIYRFIPVPITLLQMERCFEQKMAGKEMKLDKDWVAFDKISENLPRAVIASEDQLFMEHMGFDWDAMKKAYVYNAKKKGKKIKGGSTISQQVAKNVFLWSGRSYIRKGMEAYFTFLIEIFWSKKRIMEVYLNVIEMGDGIYGTEAAAQAYYKKPAADLNKKEAASIAAILPSPLHWSATKPNALVRKKIKRIMRFMRILDPIEFDN
ncbi:monofunctional biosynthetic peptidoglycan transglycosylase [Solitalea koreensis]|uniref:Biosynthetic peptidoglycan transglycosylase n=1 Tax=Solitalea koreensis TaxID=543615 RepID=A0A521CZ85_9SPHI|nr:monofunctional biosynthetic peptidoglycan transglycosylase [Solitalea koreensis]SMO64061.1 monofunctional biosynthetic peptidoglycan transglycosylase [Solitalea koreensis]